MQKIRILTVEFEGEILGHEIPAFRGAVIAKTGFQHDIFHNHDVESAKSIYRYPTIQYKRVNGSPAIVCIEDGVDEIHHFFTKKDWSIQIGEKKIPLKLKNLNLQQFTLNVWDKVFEYHIYNWIGLNQANYAKYKALTDINEQKIFLSKILIGNIISFAKGVNWDVDKPIVINITSDVDSKLTHLKGSKVIGFTFQFSCNVTLPSQIGLGKSSSLGFGTLRRKSLKHTETHEFDTHIS